MSSDRLQKAFQRLDAAVARLEAVSARRPRNERDRDLFDKHEVQVMRDRCESLERRSRDVSDRLDNAIDRMKAVLED